MSKTPSIVAGGKTFHAADVLAGAYRGKAVEERALLVHLVEVDATETPVRVLCRGVKLESTMTDAEPTDREPTCLKCAERLAKLRSKKAG